MSDDAVAPGCVLHWDGFKLSDGSEGHKYFVIVGAQQGKNYLAIRATSKAKGKSYTAGGNHVDGYYFIPGGKGDFFKLDTWLLFAEPQEFSAAELLKEKLAGKLEVRGSLRGQVANAICNCMRRCDDVSEYHRGLLGPAIQQKAKDA
jgi:hypothetical protein